MSEHLRPNRSDRGFVHMPPIPGWLSGEVMVYESSAAIEPRIWLSAEAPVNANEPTGSTVEAIVELTVEDAERLADQLRFLVEHHYQTCDRAKREAALEEAPQP